ncbi:MAG: IS66 family transposase [Acidocella sp.]|uniref:IS66 family transposase n=1 Tax=Acidocella sp. TaxID=50710 RepID=UPI003FC217E8
MDIDLSALPDDVAALKAVVIAACAKADAVAAELANEQARRADDAALIAHMKLQIEKLKRDKFGPRSERASRLLDQMAFALEELEGTATEDELAGEMAAAKTTNVTGFQRNRPARKPFPEHLPRERVVVPGPTACTCCGGERLAKLGEAVTETLETIPRSWKVIQHVREKFTCRDCEKISQAPAPFHVIRRGWAGPSFLAMLVFEKFGQHQPLNCQAERYAREGVPLSLSTLADQVGACCVVLDPIVDLLVAHVFAGERVYGDDTTVPVLAKGQTDIARSWVYVRDDRPFGGLAPPAAVFYYSRDRRGEHPQAHLARYSGILQADAFGGYNKLYEPDRMPGPITEAACWAHSRRKFFELADLAKIAKRKAQGGKPAFASPMALEAVRRIDALFDIEREINGKSATERLAVRQQSSAPLVAELADWMAAARARLSPHDDAGKAINYMLNRWPAFTRFLDDGRICLTNNAAERALRGIALGRKARLFAGSNRGGQRAAKMYSLIVTAKMNDIDSQAWLADVLARIADHPAQRLEELLPWNWKAQPVKMAA